jgi:hypothetical protein
MLFVLDKVALGQVFLRVLLFLAVSITPLTHRTSFLCHRHYTALVIDSVVKQNISVSHFVRYVYGASDLTRHEGVHNVSDKARLIRFMFNYLKPTGYVMHQQFNIQQLYALPTLHLCVSYLSENKQ